MLVKISIFVYLVDLVLYFIKGQFALFGLSVILLIVTTGLSFYISYRQVSPQLKEYEETVYKMEVNGASDDEILDFMDQDTEVDESKLLKAPLWMHLVVILGVVTSFVLLIVGIAGGI